MFKKSCYIVCFLSIFLILAGCQPKEEATTREETTGLTDEQVVQTIEAHINGNLDADGNYAIEDKVEGRARNLKLDYVHTSVHAAEGGKYYAGADMTEEASKLDLDFYVVSENGQPKVSEVLIHKVMVKAGNNIGLRFLD